MFIRKLTGKEADPPAQMAIETLRPYKELLHTITADNGKKFARHKEISHTTPVNVGPTRTRTAGTSVQPKGMDFDELTDEYVAEVEWKLNHRPGKSLGYLTPLEYFKKI